MALPYSIPYKEEVDYRQHVITYDNISGQLVLPIKNANYFKINIIGNTTIYFDQLDPYLQNLLSISLLFSNIIYIESNINCLLNFDKRFIFEQFKSFNGFQILSDKVYVFNFISLDKCITWSGELLGAYVKFNNIIHEIVTPEIVNHTLKSLNKLESITSIELAATRPTLTDEEPAYHYMSDWEISSDDNFTNIIYSSYNDTKNLNTIIIPDLILENTYYCRVKYYCFSSNPSDWSETYTFLNSY